MRGAASGDFGAVLARFRQNARVGSSQDAGCRLVACANQKPRRRIEADALAGRWRGKRHPARPARRRRPAAQMAGASWHLAAVDEELCLAVGRNDGEASAKGVCGTSAPRMLNSQAIESGRVSTTASSPALARVDCRAAILSAAAIPAYSMGAASQAARGRWPFGAPYAIDGIACEGLEHESYLGEALARSSKVPAVCSQGRSRPRALGGRFSGKPLARLGFRDLDDVEGACIDLVGGLERIAAVDKQGGLLRPYDREAGGAREARQPCEALGRGRDVLASCARRSGGRGTASSPPNEASRLRSRATRSDRSAPAGGLSKVWNMAIFIGHAQAGGKRRAADCAHRRAMPSSLKQLMYDRGRRYAH